MQCTRREETRTRIGHTAKRHTLHIAAVRAWAGSSTAIYLGYGISDRRNRKKNKRDREGQQISQKTCTVHEFCLMRSTDEPFSPLSIELLMKRIFMDFFPTCEHSDPLCVSCDP